MIIAVIPAFNEERTIGEILDRVKLFVDKIIVIDDGSTDKTAEISRQYGAEVLSHMINRGLGAALKTGFSAALKENPDIIITLDADGQHNPEDIPKLIEPIKNGSADVVIGSRFISPVTPAKAGVQKNNVVDSRVKPENDKEGGIPLFRKIANCLGNAVTYLFFGIWVSDSQSGFRAFGREALKKLNLKSSGMEISSEIIKEIKRNSLRFAEIPIKPVYTKYSLSKGQNIFEGIRTLYHLFLRKIE